jgi:hypothetical protein
MGPRLSMKQFVLINEHPSFTFNYKKFKNEEFQGMRLRRSMKEQKKSDSVDCPSIVSHRSAPNCQSVEQGRLFPAKWVQVQISRQNLLL